MSYQSSAYDNERGANEHGNALEFDAQFAAVTAPTPLSVADQEFLLTRAVVDAGQNDLDDDLVGRPGFEIVKSDEGVYVLSVWFETCEGNESVRRRLAGRWALDFLGGSLAPKTPRG